MTNEIEKNNSEIIIYQSEDGKIRLDVRLEEKTVWLTQEQIAQLYGKGRSTITEHISNIFKEGELEREKVCRKSRHTTQHGAVEGKMVQNKLHYAAHGHTAAEVIYDRADADKPFMGLTSFKGELPCINDIKIAKNYLTAEELKILNNIVSGYFDFAETQALRHRPMYMEDYVRQLDNILSANGDELLEGAGSVSHEEAMNKALIEYRKFQVKTLSPVEQDYLESIKLIEKKTKKKGSKGGM